MIKIGAELWDKRVFIYGRSMVVELDKHGPLIYRRALYILGDSSEAEDVVQEVYLKALQNARQLRSEEKLITWLYRITTNHCLNQIRNRNKRTELLERHGKTIESQNGPDPSVLLTIRKLLKEADERQAQAAIYVHVDGMRREEVAKILECSIRTVGNLLDQFNEWAKERLSAEKSSDSGLMKSPAEMRSTGV